MKGFGLNLLNFKNLNPLKVYLLLICFLNFAHDLNSKSFRTPPSEQRPPWIFGIGWNAVDDNSNAFKKLFDIRKSWNIRPYPTQLSVEKLYFKGWSFGGVFNYNQYRPGKTINGKDNSASYMFFSFDGFTKYHLNYHLRIQDRYDIYAPVGAGYTLRFAPPNRSTFTFNLGLGCNFWIREWWGINIQSVAKFGLKAPIIKTSSNYLQHSAGFVIKFDNYGRKRFPFIHARYPWVHRKKMGGGERTRRK